MLYNWFVAIRWTGDATGTVYSACYTAWGNDRDVMTATTTVNAMPSSSISSVITNIRKGISYCDSCKFYESGTTADNFIYAYLESFVTVKKIVLLPHWANRLHNIDVYVGNSTDATSSENVFVATVNADVNFKEYVLVLTTPVSGHYVLLNKDDCGKVRLCQMQVIN